MTFYSPGFSFRQKGGAVAAVWAGLLMFTLGPGSAAAQQQKAPPPVPVQVAPVETRLVSDQIALIGTAEPIARSTIASEVSGLVEFFPVREGDFVKKGDLLVRLKSTYLNLGLKGMIASRDSIRANLEFAEKELARLRELKKSRSIAETKYDSALYTYRSLADKLHQSEAQIEQLEYEIRQKEVRAPFSGFVSREHTQIGEWITPGGAVVTLLDLKEIHITVDVPGHYAVTLSVDSRVDVIIKSLSDSRIPGRISALLPQGNAAARTFPVRIRLANPAYRIKSGMEASVTFNLREQKEALLVPKDAVVTSGSDRTVFTVIDGRAMPAGVRILGYYGGHVAVAGNIKPGDRVITRGNERLRPGQAVNILN